MRKTSETEERATHSDTLFTAGAATLAELVTFEAILGASQLNSLFRTALARG
jgi:hypothetical protein